MAGPPVDLATTQRVELVGGGLALLGFPRHDHHIAAGLHELARDALAERNVVKKRLRDFKVPTRITFDNEGSEIFTIIEVDTRDRPGLLHDLARALTASNLTISSAIIATYGNQAVDAFYVKDLFGLKIRAQNRLDGIEQRLREAIAGQPAQKAS